MVEEKKEVIPQEAPPIINEIESCEVEDSKHGISFKLKSQILSASDLFDKILKERLIILQEVNGNGGSSKSYTG